MERVNFTDEMVKKFHSFVRLGMSIEDSLKLSGISERDWDTANRGKWIRKVARKEADIEDIPPHLRPREDEIDKYLTDGDFKSLVNKHWNFCLETEKDRLFLKAKLLQDIHKAHESKTSNWMASKWLLEQIDPECFGKSQSTTEKEKTTIKVEFTEKTKEDENRLENMERLISNEILGAEKKA